MLIARIAQKPAMLKGVIGASAMVVDQLFSRESIGRWLEAGHPSEAAADVALARAG